MVTNLVNTWCGDERDETGNEIVGRQRHAIYAVSPGPTKAQPHPTVVEQGETVVRQGRVQQILHHSLEALSVGGRNTSSRMDVKATFVLLQVGGDGERRAGVEQRLLVEQADTAQR